MAPTSARAVDVSAPQADPPAARTALVLGGAALAAAALGWIVARSDGFGTDPASAAEIALGAIAILAVIAAGPVACVAAIALLSASQLDPEIGALGAVSVTGADLLWVGLVGWWLARLIDRAVRGVRDPRPRVHFGQVPAIAFLAYTGVALWWIGLSDSTGQAAEVVPWLRFVTTALLAWLAATMIETRRDVRLVLGALVLGGLIAIADAALSGGDILAARSGGTLGKNALGFVAGTLLLIALFSRWTPRLRYPLGAAGALGLLLAKSVGSFVAAGVAIAIGAALAGRAREGTSTYRLARVVLALGVAVIAVFTTTQAFRPEQLPTSEEFRGGSAAQRIVVGAAGLEIFERNPVVGVGWGQSGTPSLIGDRDVMLEVRRQFPDVSSHLFPDEDPTNVHNMYIQILAELGLIGFALFIAFVIALALRAIGLLRRLGRDHELYPEAFVISLALLLALIWHNEVPIFGGQPETVIPVLLIGLLAAIARITASSPFGADRAHADGAPASPNRMHPR